MSQDVLQDIEQQLNNIEYRKAFGEEIIKYDLANCLVDARKKRNLTQEQLATLAGVSQAYIAKLESGRANPTIGHVGSLLATIWLRPKLGVQELRGRLRIATSATTAQGQPSTFEDQVITALGSPTSSGTAAFDPYVTA